LSRWSVLRDGCVTSITLGTRAGIETTEAECDAEPDPMVLQQLADARPMA
jgi:hypothetical protein